MSNEVTTEVSSRILTITLNRPDKKNALTNEMFGSFADAISSADADPDIRVILLRAAGEAFCAGADLGDFAAQNSGTFDGEAHAESLISALATCSTPIVAAVQGVAVGIGLTMLLHCDHVLLADDAELTAPFVTLGLAPEAGSSRLLSQRIGHVRAFAMFTLGDSLSAQAALTAGLANAVVPRPVLAELARGVAATFASLPAGAVRATKSLMRDTEMLRSQINAESAAFRSLLHSADAAEAFAAFAQRRAPVFE